MVIAGATERTHLQAFFAKYPTFDYDSTTSVAAEYQRLRKHFGWKNLKTQDDPRRAAADRAKHQYQDALTLQFGATYGTEDKLENWQRLCEVLEVSPIPDDLSACRKVCESNSLPVSR